MVTPTVAPEALEGVEILEVVLQERDMAHQLSDITGFQTMLQYHDANYRHARQQNPRLMLQGSCLLPFDNLRILDMLVAFAKAAG